ncbi:4-(cytidine 5'-diphospho)-2-C-methyl-D-erythritol kinase [Desnuesiella massiliensis]|uniref:4-(cytidine 5'-diphospho)-2-C-methyl-D-erythritol kinase n=1 Tax=Desnuesiella massiliensis TaxID=1650662 RepID=UPI0006E15201|nr:4-(cytidine 5'-diphospho)-2-C-methyl-D-erythritol kinase [Desnuesiella massiliensis]
MQIKAYAKINIALDVIGKREDGYHLLKMIMQTIDIYDLIGIEKAPQNIVLSCNKGFIPTDNRNLAYKAAELFINKYNIKQGVYINIKKNIPVAAGLAGGSTNAAAVLKGMNLIFNINAEESELMDLALSIGADVPYCIQGGTALCEGIGEKIKPLKPFRNHILVIVKPNFGVSTKEVYGSLDINKIFKHPDIDSLIKAMTREDLYYVANNMKNVLENVTIKKHGLLKDIKNEMLKMNALGALMSGSGPTVFAFFDDMQKAQICYDRMKMQYKEVFITRTI